jgi:hypothetical protein
MTTTAIRAMTRTSWFLPLVATGLGLACFVAFWIGGQPWEGVAALCVMVGFGALVFLGGRFELIRGLRGDGRDEYWERIDIVATALAGIVVIGVIIGMCLWEWAHGRDGSPYAQLGAIGGLAYVVAIGFLRLRS